MIVAREKELAVLRSSLDDERSHFIAVYGRRRVGKTLLIREAFNYKFTFEHAGLASGTLAEQLEAFAASLREAGLRDFSTPKSWMEAFELLKEVIRDSPAAKKVIFLDELSWMDTQRSRLLAALEFFWNAWASARQDIVFVVCASATSWIIDNVIHNKGGLHNRLTKQIHLRPFTLGECERFIAAKGVALNRHQILECYMIMGGVPYYWEFLERGKSLAQNIDDVFFAADAPLRDEYDYLYASLFRNPEPYLAIVKALCERRAGLHRDEIVKKARLASAGGLTKRLEELEKCGFVRKYHAFQKREKGTLYQLVDNFTLFHHKFLRRRPADEHYWTNSLNDGARNAWCGLAFERVCLEHVPQIKRALGISGVLTDACSWSCARDDETGASGSQIDLLLVRKDQVINLCEMKYSAGEYVVSKDTERELRRKLMDFALVSKTRCALHTTLVTTYGLKMNAYAGIVQSVVVADDLFAS